MNNQLKRIESGLDKCGVTPGPWVIHENNDGEICILNRGECGWIAEIYPYHHLYRQEERPENARIIAQCREAFKALILYVYQADRLPPLTTIEGPLEDEYKFTIKIIEAGTGWTWDEWRRWIDG